MDYLVFAVLAGVRVLYPFFFTVIQEGTLLIHCFLFDLDGTLVLTGGAGLRAFDLAFTEVFGVEGGLKSISPAGKTDPAILREICDKVMGRAPTDAEEKEVFDRYLAGLQNEVDRSSDFRIMPGIEPLLEALENNQHCLLGLGTGNIEEGARIKLDRPGLWRFFSFGGFGSDAVSRPRLLEIAIERGRRFIKDGDEICEVYVIGDTPNDIDAGKAIKARTVGVATGPFSVEELDAAGADIVFQDLSDHTTFLEKLGLL